MNTKIKEHLKRIEEKSDGMVDIPASEQTIGHIQMALNEVIKEIKLCIEEICHELTRCRK